MSLIMVRSKSHPVLLLSHETTLLQSLFRAIARFCCWFFATVSEYDDVGALKDLLTCWLVSFLEKTIILSSDRQVSKLWVLMILSGLFVHNRSTLVLEWVVILVSCSISWVKLYWSEISEVFFYPFFIPVDIEVKTYFFVRVTRVEDTLWLIIKIQLCCWVTMQTMRDISGEVSLQHTQAEPRRAIQPVFISLSFLM